MPEHRARSWALRAFAATLVLAGLTRFVTQPLVSQPTPVPAKEATPAPTPVSRDRIAIGPDMQTRLASRAPAPVRSLLNVRERMRYGQSVWNDAGVPAGPIWVQIDRRAQIISVFRAGHEIGTAVILYGAPEKPTPAGSYPVLGKAKFHRSRAYDADMPFTVWLTRDGVAIHAANVREGAATHGCIGVPKDFAKQLFHVIRPGDPVVIA
jgi:lipoprotein-anchoring transpeptidase ErfK/SrfK